MTEGGVFTQLGINPLYLISQIVSFGVLLFLLNKFLYKPILRKLDERASLIKKGAKAAEANLQTQEKIEQERQKTLKQTQKEVSLILNQARKDAKLMQEELVAQAKAEAEKIMAKKQAEIDEQLARQEKTLHDKMADLSVQVSKKVLQEYLDPKTQQKILDTQLNKIAKKQIS
ncbi:F0F1 ATP synthase subunit B [Candidatus Beckwithbacteria bacterium]|nr:F0F1 ATP synthase subunit B [Candidatus Beckwithbacteria bacterium]